MEPQRKPVWLTVKMGIPVKPKICGSEEGESCWTRTWDQPELLRHARLQLRAPLAVVSARALTKLQIGEMTLNTLWVLFLFCFVLFFLSFLVRVPWEEKKKRMEGRREGKERGRKEGMGGKNPALSHAH